MTIRRWLGAGLMSCAATLSMNRANAADENALDVFPKQSVVAIHVTDVKDTVAAFKQTSLGKWLNQPAFAPLHATIDAVRDNDPKAKKAMQVLSWFQGEFGMAIWDLGTMANAAPGTKPFPNPESRFGFVAQITADPPGQVAAELKALGGAELVTTPYGGGEILEKKGAKDGVFGIAEDYAVLGFNVDSTKTLIDGLKAPGGFRTGPGFAGVSSSLPKKPALVAALNLEEFIKAMPPPPDPKAVADGLAITGLGAIKWVLFATSIDGADFEDRIVFQFDPARSGMIGSLITEDAGTTELLAQVPADAVLVQTGFLNGEKMTVSVGELLSKIAAMAGKGEQTPAQAMAEIEAAAGFKFKDLLSPVKGPIGLWVSLSKEQGGMAPPNIGAAISFVDAGKAATAAESISNLINSQGPQKVINEGTHGGSKLFIVDAKALQQQSVPYVPCWAASGNRIFFASSEAALKQQIDIAEKKMPGLGSTPRFTETLEGLDAGARNGSLSYLDIRTLLTKGAEIGLPLAQPAAKENPLAQQVLANLPPPAELFKDFHPIIASSRVKGDRIEIIVRSPIPPAVFASFMAGALTAVAAKSPARSMPARPFEEAAPQAVTPTAPK